jgi:hypothetical protein
MSPRSGTSVSGTSTEFLSGIMQSGSRHDPMQHIRYRRTRSSGRGRRADGREKCARGPAVSKVWRALSGGDRGSAEGRPELAPGVSPCQSTLRVNGAGSASSSWRQV